MENTKIIYAVNSDLNDGLFYAEFNTREEAIKYAEEHLDKLPFVDEIEIVEDENGFEEAVSYKTIWTHIDQPYMESINFKNKAEQDEFFRLCKECGFVTLKDLENFKVNAGIADADLIQALRDYRDSLNAFDIFEDEVECQSCGTITRGLRTDGGHYVCKHCVEESVDDLVEAMEENEDMVECKECFELFPKQDGFKIEVGYLCPHCQAAQFVVADEDTFKVEFPEYERMCSDDDFLDYHSAEAVTSEDTKSEGHNDPVGEPGEPRIPEEAPVEAPVTKEETVATLIKDEQEAIEGYDKAAVEIEANPELTEEEKEEALEVIEHIKKEEIEHIEELEELVETEEVENENDPISETEIEDPEAEPVEEAMSDFKRELINRRSKMTKAELQKELESGDSLKIFYGDPREPGIRSRDYEVTLVDGIYEVTYFEETYNDDFTDSELADKFDNIDDLWDYMIRFMEDPDFTPEYNYVDELTEHVNEEHPAIESEQELEGTDNAVVDCKVADVLTHSEDEKPVDCKGEKKPLEKPLTENVSEVHILEKIKQEAEEMGYSSWIYGGSGYVAECIKISYENGIYTAEYYTSTEGGWRDTDPEYITDSEDFREVIKFLLEDGWFDPEEPDHQEITAKQAQDYLAETGSLLDESKCQDCGGELKDNKCTSCDRDYKLAKCNKCGGEVKDGKCTHCDELQEETHAQYAKPEGNRIQAFNNALTYAKRDNTDYIYGYTNHTGKFFALEQPIKVKGDAAAAEKEFRNKYKNCKVVYMAYPDKAFLKESLYNFTPEEMEEYGIDEEGYPVDGWDNYVRCNWCKEVFTEYDCVFEANLGWLCPRCQEEIRSHGGPLTIMEYPSEEDIKRTLEETLTEDSRVEDPTPVEQANTASVSGMDFEDACKQFGIEIED